MIVWKLENFIFRGFMEPYKLKVISRSTNPAIFSQNQEKDGIYHKAAHCCELIYAFNGSMN